jgi:hypothetical protein
MHNHTFALWQAVPPSARAWINNVRWCQQRNVRPEFRGYLMRSVDRSPNVARYLSGEELGWVLDRGCSQSKVESLLTLVAYLQQDHQGRTEPVHQANCQVQTV